MKLPFVLSWIVIVVGAIVIGAGAFIVAHFIHIETEIPVLGGGVGILMLAALAIGWFLGVRWLRGKS